MFLGFCAVLVMLAAVCAGGDLRRLATLQFRFGWLIFVCLVVQVLIISVLPDGHTAMAGIAHVLTYVGALLVVWFNRSMFGLPVLGLGAFCNGLAIAVNGGTLPATRSASAAAHVKVDRSGLVNAAPLAHPHLIWLGDIMASPSWLPLRNTVSIGDLLILLGAALLVWKTSGARPFRASDPGDPEPAAADAPEPDMTEPDMTEPATA